MSAAGLHIGQRLWVTDQAERLLGRLGSVVARDRGGLEITGVVRGRQIVLGVDQARRRRTLPGAWIRLTGHDCQGKCSSPAIRALARRFGVPIREVESATP